MIKNLRKAIARAKKDANGNLLQEETDPECFRSIKPMSTKRPIPMLIRPDKTEASEHEHIATELQRALYGGDHRREKPGKPPQICGEKINIGELD